ncbi:hypothetical protein GOFOIKOB_3005 [Methylobacterium tardum]|uniref:DUF6894 domain-containing protein n=1 Tax=Methylobacterium tardum TaxID=374432 RepID=A0AA37TIG9_9HYPH|nr:hypothetical protein [Methylobacterium tardum]URD38350.1 hypothetical protein M6G65_07870 [Methylobacterium tardum]GJE49964.1 hypothetical protein GOFOIKOB_3005 [Methylobacterium tardum]GLS70171.1 hypothetical protein GCM10007890_21840 [Methylobacterium tardum]
MPRFYFHLRGPNGLERDYTGLEFASIEAAYLEAYRTVPGLGADLAAQRMDPARYVFEITDPAGRLLMEVPFTEVLNRGCKPVAPRSPSHERGRTSDLIKAIRKEHAAVLDKLAETQMLLANLRTGRARRC